MSKRGPTPHQISAALATAALTGVALVLHRRRRSTSSTGSAGGSVSQEWTCECGQAFRVHGEGRHRVYWLPDAEPGDPLLDDRCPNCERQLSGTSAAP